MIEIRHVDGCVMNPGGLSTNVSGKYEIFGSHGKYDYWLYNSTPEKHLSAVLNCLLWVRRNTIDEYVSVNGRIIHMRR